jgi:hypothetical protein
MFLHKSVKEIHPCHALRHIGEIFCCWMWSEGNYTVAWKGMIHPRRNYMHGVHSRYHPRIWRLSGAHTLIWIPARRGDWLRIVGAGGS